MIFQRQGLQKDLEDNRTSPLIHILDILKTCSAKPKSILLENVMGFEKSNAHRELIDTMTRIGYKFQVYFQY